MIKCPTCGMHVQKVEQNGVARYFEVTLKKTQPIYKIMTKHFCKFRRSR